MGGKAMTAREVAKCGVLYRQGGKYPTAVFLAGCGEPVKEHGHAVRWQPGEGAVIYHPECCPLSHPHDGTGVRPTPRKVRI